MDTGLRVNRLFAITLPALMADHEPEHGGGPVAGRLPRRQRRDAHRQPDRVPAVHHPDPVRDHDRGDHVRAWSRGPRSRPAGSARCSTPQPTIADPPTPDLPGPPRPRSSSATSTFGYPGAEEPGPAQHLVRGQPGRDDGDRRLHGQRQDARSSTCCRASTTRPAAPCSSTASTSATSTARTCGAGSAMVPQKAFLFGGIDRVATSATATRRRPTTTCGTRSTSRRAASS